MDPYLLSLAISGAVAAYLVLLFAHRRIPRLPPPDSILALREDFYGLSEQFLEFVEKHDADMGRYYAKVGTLRRKLRKLQEDEGIFEEDDEEEVAQVEPTPPVLTKPALKAELRRRMNAARQA